MPIGGGAFPASITPMPKKVTQPKTSKENSKLLNRINILYPL